MAGSTNQGPITVENLIIKLKLLPLDWRIQITNSEGDFYITDLTIEDNCIVTLNLEPIP